MQSIPFEPMCLLGDKRADGATVTERRSARPGRSPGRAVNVQERQTTGVA
jgi:hypothetical protein